MWTVDERLEGNRFLDVKRITFALEVTVISLSDTCILHYH